MCINGCCLFRIYEKLCCFRVGKYNLVGLPDQINRNQLILPISTIRKTKVLRIVSGYLLIEKPKKTTGRVILPVMMIKGLLAMNHF